MSILISPNMHMASFYGIPVPRLALHHPRQMADNAFEWARSKGLLRKNPIHGAGEADIPKDEEWTRTKESGSTVGFRSHFSMEVAQQNLYS